MSLASWLPLMCSLIHCYQSQSSTTESTAGKQLQTVRASTMMPQTSLQMESSIWATTQLLGCSPTASQSRCASLPSCSREQQWGWSELDSEIAFDWLETVTEMPLELELDMASGVLLGSTLIVHVHLAEIQHVWLASLLRCVLFGLKWMWEWSWRSFELIWNAHITMPRTMM